MRGEIRYNFLTFSYFDYIQCKRSRLLTFTRMCKYIAARRSCPVFFSVIRSFYFVLKNSPNREKKARSCHFVLQVQETKKLAGKLFWDEYTYPGHLLHYFIFIYSPMIIVKMQMF